MINVLKVTLQIFFILLQETTENCQLSIAVSPRSPFFNLIKRRLFYAVEHGFAKYWTGQFMEGQKQLVYDKNIRKLPPQVLSVKDLRGAFLFLFIGYALAGACFVMELFSNRGVQISITE